MEYIDLHKQQKLIKKKIDSRIATVLAHGQYIMGPEVAELEHALCNFIGAKHCVACASGSQALELVLAAWGIGPGDAVFTTPFSFIATAEAIVRCGATPVFVDIDPYTYNLDEKLLEKAIQAVQENNPNIYPLPKTGQLKPKLILPVDLFGNPAPYSSILYLANKYGLQTLEDGAQGFGSSYNNKRLCNTGCDAATTSFFPAKPLGCYGDGGAIFTNDKDLADILDSLRYHGRADKDHKNDNVRLGYNGRLDTLQAAILLAKLEIFPHELELRIQAGKRYNDLLSSFIPAISRPAITAGGICNWAQYTIRLPEHADRNSIMRHMTENGIPTYINYPKSMHMQKSMAFLGYKNNDFPEVTGASQHVLSLPMHPYLTELEQDKIITTLNSALREAS